MPRPVTVVYQPKGRRHLQYINTMALRIWKDTYGCKEGEGGQFWRQSLKDAMTAHRNYLKTGIKARPRLMHADVLDKTPPKIEFPKAKVKREGIFWKDPVSGLWMPMEC